MTAEITGMDEGWEIEVTRYATGSALVAPEVWYAALTNQAEAVAAVKAATTDSVGPALLSVRKAVSSADLAAMGVAPGQVWKWRKTAVSRDGSSLGFLG